MPSFHYHKCGKKNDFAFPLKIRGPIFANQTRILLPIFMTSLADVLDSDVLDDLLTTWIWISCKRKASTWER